MKKFVSTKISDIEWYRDTIKKIWSEEASSPEYIYDHPLYTFICRCIQVAKKNSKSEQAIFRTMANRIILEWVEQAWDSVDNALLEARKEISWNQLCRGICSKEEVEVIWENLATYLRWNCYSDAQMNMLYYDQKIFADRNNPHMTMSVFEEFMKHWRELNNIKVEKIVQEELEKLEFVIPSLVNRRSEEMDLDLEDVEIDGGTGEDEPSEPEGISYDEMNDEDLYNNNFNRLLNWDLYKRYQEKVHEIVNTLGRMADTEQVENEVVSLLQYSFPAPPYDDIEGVSAGNRIMDILPSEHAIMSDPESEILFYQKYASRQLQQFSCFPKEIGNKTHITSKSEKGPIIISIDTSGSMVDDPVDFARLLVVDVFDIAQKEKRPLYVVQFSVGAQYIDLSGENGREELLTFLENADCGDSDGEAMLLAILRQLEDTTFKDADALIVSDFEFDYCKHLEKEVKDAQSKGARFYALNVRPGHANSNYAKLLDKIWEIRLGF